MLISKSHGFKKLALSSQIIFLKSYYVFEKYHFYD